MKTDNRYPVLPGALMFVVIISFAVVGGEPSPDWQVGSNVNLSTDMNAEGTVCEPGWVRHLGKACLVEEHLYAVYLEDGTVLSAIGSLRLLRCQAGTPAKGRP